MTLKLKRYFTFIIPASAVIFFAACGNSSEPPETDVVKETEKLAVHVSANIDKLLKYAGSHDAKINDSVALHSSASVAKVYSASSNLGIWSEEDSWKPQADSMFNGILHAKEDGLFPSDYHFSDLEQIRKQLASDSTLRRDAALWAKADLLLTDAWIEMAKHLKLGRIGRDSITQRNDSLFTEDYFLKAFSAAVSTNSIMGSLHRLEPTWPEYLKVKNGIKSFLDSADLRPYTWLDYPAKDSLQFRNNLAKRLQEEGLLYNASPDTTAMADAIRNYQAAKEVKITGKISDGLVRMLNNTDAEKFKRIAITLDRYKLMAGHQPETYVLVNLPAYTLYVYDSDSIPFTSRVIVGTPKTNTPLLNGSISNFITYPQWTVPYSIIFKEMLPKIQKDINYLARQNLMVVDGNDSVRDPHLIDWSKLDSKHFPYLIRQRQGDDNSLGVIKFNFANKYSVYLHDTNARSLFGRSARALSHGCVRVQKWEELSRFLVRSDTMRFPTDTLAAWIQRQEKHTVSGFPRVPLYIRYFTVEGKNGRLNFYSDIYGYDRIDRNKYFSKRSV